MIITYGRGKPMHTHFSVLHGVMIFLTVAIVGTAWRLIASHLIANRSDFWTPVGEAMLFQY